MVMSFEELEPESVAVFEPIIGDIVHVKAARMPKNLEDSQQIRTLPAIVIALHGDLKVDVVIFASGGTTFLPGISWGEGYGYWQWPSQSMGLK